MLIDLSVPLNNQTPVYPGDPPIKVEEAGVFEKDGYRDHAFSLNTHAGTHVDAPSHMVKEGKNLSQFPLEKFFGRGVCIKVEGQFNLDEIKKTQIREGDIVLFYTGEIQNYHYPKYFSKHSVFSEELANYLIEKRVKMVGVDMCSPDVEPFPIHRILLKEEILIIENLTNLDLLVGKEFKLYAFPLKLDLDGAPVRAVAEVLE